MTTHATELTTFCVKITIMFLQCTPAYIATHLITAFTTTLHAISSVGGQTYAYDIAGGLNHFWWCMFTKCSSLLCSLVISFFSTSDCPQSQFCVKVHKKQRNTSIKPDLPNLTSSMFTETLLQLPIGFRTAL